MFALFSVLSLLLLRSYVKNVFRGFQFKGEDKYSHNMNDTSGSVAIVSKPIIENVFGENAFNLNISSTKSMTGHLLGAAGAIEAISCVLSIKNGIVPPTINHFNDDPEIDNNLNFTFNKAQKRKVSVAMSNTFGFGGHNACVLIKEFVD